MKTSLCLFGMTLAISLHAASLEVYHDLAAFESRVGTLNLVTFDDLPTGGETPFSSDHYQASAGMSLYALGGVGQFAGDSFGHPVDFNPVSSPNVYSPGPVGASSSPCVTRIEFHNGDTPSLTSAFGCWYIDSDVSQYPCCARVYDSGKRLWQEELLPVGSNGEQQFIGFVCVDDGGTQVAGIGRVDVDSGRGWPATSGQEGVVLDDFYCAPPSGSPTIAEARVSRFDDDNEGWWLWDAPISNGVLPAPGTTGINESPAAESGALLVGDLGYDWLYAIAPGSWAGDWSGYHMLNARVTPGTAEGVTIPAGYYLADGFGSSAENAAILVMDELMAAGVTSRMTVSLDETRWEILRGNWQDLLASVQVFGVRLDLNGLVTPEETHLLHEVVVGPLPQLEIAFEDPNLRVFWQGVPSLNYILCHTVDLDNWTVNAVLPGEISMQHLYSPASQDRRFWRVEIE